MSVAREREKKIISMFYVRIDYWLCKAMNNLVSWVSSTQEKEEGIATPMFFTENEMRVFTLSWESSETTIGRGSWTGRFMSTGNVT